MKFTLQSIFSSNRILKLLKEEELYVENIYFSCATSKLCSLLLAESRLTLLLKTLSWLPVKDQLNYRQSFMAFECMTAVTPLNTLRPNLLPVSKLANERLGVAKSGKHLSFQNSLRTENLLLQDC